jgi:hypothetical protein
MMKVIMVIKGVCGKFNTAKATISIIRTIIHQIIAKNKNN